MTYTIIYAFWLHGRIYAFHPYTYILIFAHKDVIKLQVRLLLRNYERIVLRPKAISLFIGRINFFSSAYMCAMHLVFAIRIGNAITCLSHGVGHPE